MHVRASTAGCAAAHDFAIFNELVQGFNCVNQRFWCSDVCYSDLMQIECDEAQHA